MRTEDGKATNIDEYEVREMLSAHAIDERVRELAAVIDRDYPDESEPLLLICVLKGAFLFLSDLIRYIRHPVQVDFVVIRSYEAGTVTTGNVRVLKDIDANVAGKHVIIVEDILDTGLTLAQSGLIKSMRDREAATVRVCVLLDKPERRRVEISADYQGFEIADEFVVGYGMDLNEAYRNLPYIGILSTRIGISA